jgi:hypothetical protein
MELPGALLKCITVLLTNLDMLQLHVVPPAMYRKDTFRVLVPSVAQIAL